MEIAYLRELKHTKQCELMFHLKITNENNTVILEGDVRSVRQTKDTIESLLQHTKNKIIKMLEDKENIEVNVCLTHAGSNVANNVVCGDFIKQFSKPLSPKTAKKLIFKAGKQSFQVIVNAPLINQICLPHILYVGYSLQCTKFKALFTEKHLCRNIWSTSADKKVWQEVGIDYKYTPTISDLNKFLKLRCIPCNERVEGPPFEVISSVTIQQMCPIPKCPFEERHKLTNAMLKGNSVRIVSYNTLSDLYCNDGQFSYCSPETLSIDYRKQLLRKELEGYLADIICLQELDNYVFKQYLNVKLSKQYHGVFNRKGKRISEGLACFFSSSRFGLLGVRHIVFSEEVRWNSLFQSTWKLLQPTQNLKDNIIKHPTSLQLTVLLKRDSQDIFIVANTHLYYHADASDIRLIQASIALDYISSIVDEYKHSKPSTKVGVIFCGDFNSVPESPVFEFFCKGFIQHTFESECSTPLKNVTLKHPFKFVSACGVPKYTNYTDDFKACLDYIFYDENVFKLIDYVPFPDESVLSENTALPSKVFPSDHIALIAHLRRK